MLTFTVVNCARYSGMAAPMMIRVAPTSRKNSPEGNRRSSMVLPENEVQPDKENGDGDSQRTGPLIPA